jgi:hypothetical protein
MFENVLADSYQLLLVATSATAGLSACRFCTRIRSYHCAYTCEAADLLARPAVVKARAPINTTTTRRAKFGASILLTYFGRRIPDLTDSGHPRAPANPTAEPPVVLVSQIPILASGIRAAHLADCYRYPLLSAVRQPAFGFLVAAQALPIWSLSSRLLLTDRLIRARSGAALPACLEATRPHPDSDCGEVPNRRITGDGKLGHPSFKGLV